MHISVTSLEKGLKASFFKALAEQPDPIAPKIATIVSSDSDSEKYGWLGDLPGVSEFVDERKVTGLSEASYTVTNKKWELTLGVKRDHISDDKLGFLPLRIQSMAQAHAQHPDQLLIETLVAGTTGTGYDGYAFFGDAHPARGAQTATQDNLLAGTGVTLATLKADFAAAKAAMMSFKDEGKLPFHRRLDPRQLFMVVPPAVETVALELVNATMISSTSNVLVGAANVIVDGLLSDANDWYLLYCGYPIKPLVFQDREPIEFGSLEGATEQGFNREIYEYGTRARYNAGYGLWQCAVKTVNS